MRNKQILTHIITVLSVITFAQAVWFGIGNQLNEKERDVLKLGIQKHMDRQEDEPKYKTNICIDDIAEREHDQQQYQAEKKSKKIAYYGGKTFFRIRQMRMEYGKDVISIQKALQKAQIENTISRVDVDRTDNINEKYISRKLWTAAGSEKADTKVSTNGSKMYTLNDKEFRMKTITSAQLEFVIKRFLLAYYLNMLQNPNSVMFRWHGVYHYDRPFLDTADVIVILMEDIMMGEDFTPEQIFDIKGQADRKNADTRAADMKERRFLAQFPGGLYLDAAIYEKLVKAIREDCNALEGVKVTDYSLIVAIRELKNGDVIDAMDGLTRSGRVPRKILATDQDGTNPRAIYLGIVDVLTKYQMFFGKSDEKGKRALEGEEYFGTKVAKFAQNDLFHPRDPEFVEAAAAARAQNYQVQIVQGQTIQNYGTQAQVTQHHVGGRRPAHLSIQVPPNIPQNIIIQSNSQPQPANGFQHHSQTVHTGHQLQANPQAAIHHQPQVQVGSWPNTPPATPIASFNHQPQGAVWSDGRPDMNLSPVLTPPQTPNGFQHQSQGGYSGHPSSPHQPDYGHNANGQTQMQSQMQPQIQAQATMPNASFGETGGFRMPEANSFQGHTSIYPQSQTTYPPSPYPPSQPTYPPTPYPPSQPTYPPTPYPPSQQTYPPNGFEQYNGPPTPSAFAFAKK